MTRPEELPERTDDDGRGLVLGPREAHVWYAWTARCSTPALLERYRAWLAPHEHARLARFAFEPLKVEYLVTRALCRATLSRYADVAPADWSFTTDDYGKPAVADPALAWLRFNLSNARSIVACIVARDRDVGIDVEEIDRHGDPLSIADHHFSRSELRGLRALPAAARLSRFFELWTLKEAYIKAVGKGLSMPLDRFSLTLDEPALAIRFDPPSDDDARAWQFALHRPGPAHVLGFGIHREAGTTWSVRLRETVPGVRSDDAPTQPRAGGDADR